MDPVTLALIVKLAEVGVPAFIRLIQNLETDTPTVEDIQALRIEDDEFIED